MTASGESRPRFGPYHRRTRHFPQENRLVVESGVVWGKPPGNFYAAIIPCVQAWGGPLPEGIIGFEFYTDVEPDPGSPPQSPEWSEGRPGVIVLERNELVAIPVVVTMRRDAE
jgi:hypothetical protein